MPIGTIIGFLIGTLIASAIVILTEVDLFKNNTFRNEATIAQSKHRSHYALWLLGSIFGLAGTFIEMGLT